MPPRARYGPTLQTSVQIWRVRLRFVEGVPVQAERLSELGVKGLAVDCAAHGGPFCIIFWPLVASLEGLRAPMGLEVRVTGLRGPTPELSFYYQVAAFRQEQMYERWLQEAFGAFKTIRNQWKKR